MAGNYHSLALAVALMSALLAVQAFDLQRSLLPPELASLSAAQLRALTSDPDCERANPQGATVRKEATCAGCTTVKTCVYGGSNLWIAGKSSNCTGRTPWCNDGVCSATPSPTENCNSATADDTFKCPANGYWPNLASCNKYWMCTTTGAFAGDCSGYNNAVYDPSTTLCVPKSQATCSTINCKNAAAYQVVPSAPWLYAVCTSDNVAEAVVLSCANQNQQYNGTNCVNACNKAGRFPLYEVDGTTVTDTASYFECVANGNKLIGPSVGKCPSSGSTFNAQTSQCTLAADLKTPVRESPTVGTDSTPTDTPTSTTAPSTTQQTSAPDCNRPSSCVNSTHLRLCVFTGGRWFKARDVKCPASKPHCEDDECHAVPSSDETSDSFLCSADGYFPDVSSCTRYFVCAGSTAYVRDCSAYPNATYDPNSAQCVVGRPCYTLDCSDPRPYQLYAPAPWLFAVCRDDDAADALVLACGPDQVYNGTDCARACLRPGRFADTTGASKYFECVELGDGTYSDPTPKVCPGGLVFSGEGLTGRCVEKEGQETTTQATSTTAAVTTETTARTAV